MLENICMCQVTLGADLVARGVHGVHSVDSVHNQARGVHSLPASFTKRNQWNKAVSEAEKLVSWLKNYNIFEETTSFIPSRAAENG